MPQRSKAFFVDDPCLVDVCALSLMPEREVRQYVFLGLLLIYAREAKKKIHVLKASETAKHFEKIINLTKNTR